MYRLNNLAVTRTTKLNDVEISMASISSRLTIKSGGLSIYEGGITVSGNISVNNDVTVIGTSRLGNWLSISGISYLRNQLSVSGIVTLLNRMSISESLHVINNLSIYSSTTLGNSLSVGGQVYMRNQLSVSGSTILQTDLSVNGVIFTNNIQGVHYNDFQSQPDGSNASGYILNIGTSDGPNTINIGQYGDIVTIFGSKTIVNATEVNISVSQNVYSTNISVSGIGFFNNDIVASTNVSISGTVFANYLSVVDSNVRFNGLLNNNLSISGISYLADGMSVNGNANFNGSVSIFGTVFTDYLSVVNNIFCNGEITSSSQLTASSGAHFGRYKLKDYIYFPDEVDIYNDIISAYDDGVFTKNGNPNGWDETSNRTNLWNGLKILKIGDGQNSYPNGMRVVVSGNRRVIWLRCLNDRWTNLVIYRDDGTLLGSFVQGLENLNTISPDGGVPDQYWNVNKWIPIPVPSTGTYIITSGIHTSSGGWISGIAFSTNPWNHAKNICFTYHTALNGGTTTPWNSDNWNSAPIANLDAGNIYTLYVPVVPSGRDKVLYFVMHSNNWDEGGHASITVEDVPIERLRKSFLNPFVIHFRSQYSRHFGSFVPANLVAGKRFIKVVVDMANTSNPIVYREIGTYDYY